MTVKAQVRESRASSDSLFVTLISGLIVTLGLFAISFLLVQILTNDAVIRAESFNDGILAFLRTYGILLPVVVIYFGVYLIRLGIRLYRRDYTASLWARQVLMWLTIIALGALVPAILSGNILGTVVIVAVGLAVGAAFWWMRGTEHLFEGQETLSSRNARVAWNLLVPTIAVLIVVALQPLEQTFIASLTDEEFATDQEEVNFIGFANYAQLLGVRLDTLPCETVEGGTTCATEVSDDGGEAIVYPSARGYLREAVDGYRDLGYRPTSEFDLFGNRYVISARDADFLSSIGNTLGFTVISVTLELIIGLFVAMVVNSKFPGRGLMRAAMLIPWAIPTVVSARLWEVMLRDGSSGIVNRVLEQSGLIDQPLSWLTQSNTQVLSMVFVDVWKTTPFMALILLAGLQVIPDDVYEAADVDGASRIRKFFSITLPLLRPTIAVALVFRTLDAVRVFDVFQVLLGERSYSMATYNYTQLVLRQEFGYASAIGVLIFIIILLFTIAYVRILGVEAD